MSILPPWLVLASGGDLGPSSLGLTCGRRGWKLWVTTQGWQRDPSRAALASSKWDTGEAAASLRAAAPLSICSVRLTAKDGRFCAASSQLCPPLQMAK